MMAQTIKARISQSPARVSVSENSRTFAMRDGDLLDTATL
jgi:hypothetical protein